MAPSGTQSVPLRRSARRLQAEQNRAKEQASTSVESPEAIEEEPRFNSKNGRTSVLDEDVPSTSSLPQRASKRISDLKQKKEQQIQKTLQQKRDSEEDGQLCNICLCSCARGAVRLVDCGHHFHKRCILKWLSKKRKRDQTCPLCRRIPREMRTVTGGRKVPLPPPDAELDFSAIFEQFMNLLGSLNERGEI